MVSPEVSHTFAPQECGKVYPVPMAGRTSTLTAAHDWTRVEDRDRHRDPPGTAYQRPDVVQSGHRRGAREGCGVGNEIAFGMFVKANIVAVVWYALFVVLLFLWTGRPSRRQGRLHVRGLVSLLIGAVGVIIAVSRVASPGGQLGRLGAVMFLNVPRSGSAIGASSELYVMGLDDRVPRRITRRPGIEMGARWSPDGTRIAYWGVGTSSAVSDSPIWMVPARGGRPRAITHGEIDASPAWSPDGTRLVFARTASPSTLDLSGSVLESDFHFDFQHAFRQDLFIGNSDGTVLEHLTNTEETSEDAPAWSPDGSLIAYVHEYGEEDWGVVRQVWTVRPDGTERHAVTDGLNWDMAPRWLDDDTIVFMRLRSEEQRWYPWTVTLDGGEPHPLDRVGPIGAFAPLPDGRLVVAGDQESPPIEIVDPDTGEREEVAKPGGFVIGVDASADGRRVVYTGPASDEIAPSMASAMACAVMGPLALLLAVWSRREERPAWPGRAGLACGITLTAWFLVALVGYPEAVHLIVGH